CPMRHRCNSRFPSGPRLPGRRTSGGARFLTLPSLGINLVEGQIADAAPVSLRDELTKPAATFLGIHADKMANEIARIGEIAGGDLRFHVGAHLVREGNVHRSHKGKIALVAKIVKIGGSRETLLVRANYPSTTFHVVPLPPSWRSRGGLAALHVPRSAGHSDGERLQLPTQHDLAGEAGGSGDVEGQVEEVFFFFAGGGEFFEILGGDDDVAGGAGHLALACAFKWLARGLGDVEKAVAVPAFRFLDPGAVVGDEADA